MKKIPLLLLVCVTVNLQVSAQVDTTRTKFYYYPSLDVYYNNSNGDYWYFDKPTTHWMNVKILPANYKVDTVKQRHEVWYNGPDVWKDNIIHQKKYKNLPGVKQNPAKR